MALIAGFILRLFGWKITGNIPVHIKKSVMIIAPHTSQWDFIIGRLACWKLGINAKFLIKKEFFFFPVGYILESLGAVPVNRAKGAGIVPLCLEIINRYDKVTITITPEGTRKYNENWKKGFYFIAEKAQVPIILGYLNYKDRTGGVGGYFSPSGNFTKDFLKIEEFYRKNAFARHPDRFNLQAKPEDIRQ